MDTQIGCQKTYFDVIIQFQKPTPFSSFYFFFFFFSFLPFSPSLSDYLGCWKSFNFFFLEFFFVWAFFFFLEAGIFLVKKGLVDENGNE